MVETFANPPVLAPDADGVHTLEFGPYEVVLDGQRHCVRAYNGLYPGPTLVTPARTDAPRQVRVDAVNGFREHAFRSLAGQTCVCIDDAGRECHTNAHGACPDADVPDCTCVDAEGEVCEHVFDFNITNLHAHGSHVEPDFANGGGCEADGNLRCRDCDTDVCDGDPSDDTCFFSDDVISHVPHGTGNQYRWDVDQAETHHEGLHWYHPHIHGSTAIQVASGAAGAWIVRGPLDAVPGIADARERVLSTPPIGTNGFEPLEDGVDCTEESVTFDDFSVLASAVAPQRNLINGLRVPRMLTAPGQVERWRFLHAGFLDEVFLGVFRGLDTSCTDFSVAPEDRLTLTQIARDGITLPEPYPSDYVFASPGYRVEAVVGGDDVVDGDTWCLVARRALQDGGGDPLSPPDAPSVDDIFELLEAGDVTAVLNVAATYGTATATVLPTPDALAAVAPVTTLQGRSAQEVCDEAALVDAPADMDQGAVLQVGFWTADIPDPCGCDNYNINCRNFETVDRSRYPVDRDLPLGAVEHWRLRASVDGHPFHIHVNPFIACPSDNVFDPVPFPRWRDTYLVNLDREVDLLTEYATHTGTFVTHCHKLTHEDDGMMQLLRVCDPATDPTCGDNHWRACDPDDLACVPALAMTDCALATASDVESAACVADLGGPAGVCGDNGCVGDEDCGFPLRCVDHVCAP
ncbi:MAG: L-ascorbate oxidase [Myxococcota bacterium]